MIKMTEGFKKREKIQQKVDGYTLVKLEDRYAELVNKGVQALDGEEVWEISAIQTRRHALGLFEYHKTGDW